jgi:uncharacterized protein (DUF488 family)
MINDLFTLGHSTMESTIFVGLLRRFAVNFVVDVRSTPRSNRFPQFEQVELGKSLEQENIRYLFMGEELGGRPDDPKAYRKDGLVDYRERRKSYAFHAGVERVLSELARENLALLCAEEDPITCHRFLMICPELIVLGVEPHHIRKGGILETQKAAEDRLLLSQQFGAVVGASLFSDERDSALENAYIAQAEKCAFRADPQQLDPW